MRTTGAQNNVATIVVYLLRVVRLYDGWLTFQSKWALPAIFTDRTISNRKIRCCANDRPSFSIRYKPFLQSFFRQYID